MKEDAYPGPWLDSWSAAAKGHRQDADRFRAVGNSKGAARETALAEKAEKNAKKR